VDLLATGDVQGLEERVHVLPAVELTKAANVSVSDRYEGIAGAISVDKLLYVTRLDLAAVVDDIAIRVDHDLGKIASGIVNLRKAERDEAIRKLD